LIASGPQSWIIATVSMPTGVLRQNTYQRLSEFIAKLAEGRKPSGLAVADVPDGLRRAAMYRNRIVSA